MEVNRRWIERSAHFHEIYEQLANLTRRCRPTEKPDICNDAAFVKLFEIAFELAVKTLQDYLRFRGFGKAQDARQTILLAIDNGVPVNRDQWHGMLRDSDCRNYIYNLPEMHNIAQRIYNSYVFALGILDDTLRKEAEEQ